jgi:hypothetical protein
MEEAGTGAGTAVVGVGVADGDPAGELDGARHGGLDGDGVVVGDGADHVSSWHPDFMAVDVSSGALSLVRGDPVGFSSTGAGDSAYIQDPGTSDKFGAETLELGVAYRPRFP